MKTEFKEEIAKDIDEVKSLSKKDLIEEVFRLRMVVVKGNVEARKKTLQERNAEVKKMVEKLRKKYKKDGRVRYEEYKIGHLRKGKLIALQELLQKLGLGDGK